MHACTWLWSCIKVLLQERHGVDFLGVSCRVEKLHSSKLSWAAAQLVETWCEVKPPWIWGSKVDITFTQAHQFMTLYESLTLKNHISFCAVWFPDLATCSHMLSCPSCWEVPRILWALLPHHIPGWSPCCCCGGLPPEDSWRKRKVSHWLTMIAVQQLGPNTFSKIIIRGFRTAFKLNSATKFISTSHVTLACGG